MTPLLVVLRKLWKNILKMTIVNMIWGRLRKKINHSWSLTMTQVKYLILDMKNMSSQFQILMVMLHKILVFHLLNHWKIHQSQLNHGKKIVNRQIWVTKVLPYVPQCGEIGGSKITRLKMTRQEKQMKILKLQIWIW